jgi:hypothetical protein
MLFDLILRQNSRFLKYFIANQITMYTMRRELTLLLFEVLHILTGELYCRVRAYGPGIEPTGPVVGAPANFTVETFSAGKGQVDVTVLNPSGKPEPVSQKSPLIKYEKKS